AGQAEALGAGGDHLFGGLDGADSARGLDAEAIADRLPHEGDRMGAGPAGRVESGGGLDETGTGGLGAPADLDDLLIGQGGRFDDDLDQRPAAGLDDSADIGFDGVEVTGDGRSDVDDHVDLGGPVGHGPLRLGGLDLGLDLAGRESDDGRDDELSGI